MEWDCPSATSPSELPAGGSSCNLAGSVGLLLGRSLSWACGQPDRLRALLGLPVGLSPSPQGSPGKAEKRLANLEHFRAAMTSVLVLKISVPQTRQCGQGLRTYCKYQPGLPISVPMTLWGAGPGQPLLSAFSSHHCIQGKVLAWTFLVKMSQGPQWGFGGGPLHLRGGLRLRV